jgi:hypothetical protein
MVLRSALLLLSVWSTCSSWCLGQESQPAGSVQTIDLGNRRELFVDRFLIETLDGLSHKLHEPKATEPMEQPADAMEYGTIIKDGPLFRMYTRDGHAHDSTAIRPRSPDTAKAQMGSIGPSRTWDLSKSMDPMKTMSS